MGRARCDVERIRNSDKRCDEPKANESPPPLHYSWILRHLVPRTHAHAAHATDRTSERQILRTGRPTNISMIVRTGIDLRSDRSSIQMPDMSHNSFRSPRQLPTQRGMAHTALVCGPRQSMRSAFAVQRRCTPGLCMLRRGRRGSAAGPPSPAHADG